MRKQKVKIGYLIKADGMRDVNEREEINEHDEEKAFDQGIDFRFHGRQDIVGNSCLSSISPKRTGISNRYYEQFRLSMRNRYSRQFIAGRFNEPPDETDGKDFKPTYIYYNLPHF
jgi:hypothetical protein